MSEGKTAFPLCWPENWPRARFRKPSQFSRTRSIETARSFLFRELYLLGVPRVTLSSNLRLRGDGLPASSQSTPPDPGVAIYFKLKNRDVALACDKWERVQDNIYAIGKHIEALRGQERWGVGNVEQAFRGYMALPEHAGNNWWETLGVAVNASYEQARDAYRAMVKRYHPDVETGDAVKFRAAQAAWESFEQMRRAAA